MKQADVTSTVFSVPTLEDRISYDVIYQPKV